LRSPRTILGEKIIIVTSNKTIINKPKSQGANLGFEEKLWAAADKLRGQIDSAEYKHIVLGLIFLKYISDGLEKNYRQLDLWTTTQQDKLENERPFTVPKEASFTYLQWNANQQNIGELVDGAMAIIERENLSLKDALPQNYASLDSRRLRELIELLGTIELKDAESRTQDIIGRVYEYFLGQFARLEGKGGEFYTPQSVVKLLVEMAEPYRGSVYDPCCGSGGIFVQSEKFVKAYGGRTEDILIYGQESNFNTWKLCKLNLALREIKANIGSQNADTFHQDLHPDLKADFILTNPPFNISDWGASRLLQDDRWQYGIPPVNNANYAWIQHIIYRLAPNGIAGFVMSNGSLNHSHKEGEIRKAIIEADLIDCIVALPSQLFYTTQIAACLWFITKNKKDVKLRNRSGETLFICADRLGKMSDRTHRFLADEDISLIANTYHSWRSSEKFSNYKDIPGFCKSATIAEINSHKNSLIPGRYVGFERKKKQWNMEQMRDELTEIKSRVSEVYRASEIALTVLHSFSLAEPLLKRPSHWQTVTLEPHPKSEFIIHVDSGGTPSTKKDEFWNGKIPWLTPKEITGFTDSFYVSKTERTITQKGLSGSAAKLLPPGTVMLTKRAPVGAVAINAVPMANNQGFLNFQCGEKLRPLYLAYWLRANKEYLENIANGSTYLELYKSDLFEVKIKVPTLAEQDAIIQVISALQYVALLGLPLEQSVTKPEETIKMQEQNMRLRSILDAILPKLLSGEIDVYRLLEQLK
jgi:type I restriction enzyme M protein